MIAGKGHETYQIIGDNTEYFDDREECREALQHVDALHAAGVDTSEFPWRYRISVSLLLHEFRCFVRFLTAGVLS